MILRNFSPQIPFLRKIFRKQKLNCSQNAIFYGVSSKIYPWLRTSEDKYTLGQGIFAKTTHLAMESGLKKWPLGAASIEDFQHHTEYVNIPFDSKHICRENFLQVWKYQHDELSIQVPAMWIYNHSRHRRYVSEGNSLTKKWLITMTS